MEMSSIFLSCKSPRTGPGSAQSCHLNAKHLAAWQALRHTGLFTSFSPRMLPASPHHIHSCFKELNFTSCNSVHILKITELYVLNG